MSNLLEVDDLLTQLSSEGELQSSGRFTVDVSKAKEKLAQFQFEDAFYYILKLVQAAVAGGASGLSLQSRTAEVEVTILGLGFTPYQLENVLYSLMADSSETTPALRHFAMGLNAAVSTRASEITVQSFDGKEGLEVRWTKKSQRSSAWAPGQRLAQTRLLLKRTAADVLSDIGAKIGSRDVFSMFSGDRKGMDREQALIYDHGAFCPMPISINGRPCPGYDLGVPAYSGVLGTLWSRLFDDGSSVDPKHHLFEIYLPQTGASAITGPRLTHSRWPRGYAKNGLYSAILVVPARLADDTVIMPVRDGISLKPFKVAWDGPGSILYLDAKNLEVDLTETRLIKNEKTLGILNDLGRALCEGGQQYLNSGKAIPSSKLRSNLTRRLEEGINCPMVFI
ncbi:MAG: hypothetical protein KF760_13910 [Candidatus Eremiobacteraeota bacterium]|nr:hypothetical protein [Candidatus Eremiobacteraeota bacterium]MCW5871106.1 hypothetical protein [Candidatus Eremiobacteraeota bacterium]